MSVFQKEQVIGKFTIKLLIKEDVFCETYKVIDSEGTYRFMKLFKMSEVPELLLTEDKEVFEIEICKKLTHKNLITFIESDSLQIQGKAYHYMITEYYTGGLVAERIINNEKYSLEEAIQIICGVLEGLDYLHQQNLIHNDINARNIMIHKEGETIIPKIIDMGHTSYPIAGKPFFSTNDLMPFNRAPETYKGMYVSESDIFSAGILFYYMLFGKRPWEVDISDFANDKAKVKEAVKRSREQELTFDGLETPLPDHIRIAIENALKKNPDERISSANLFIDIIQNKASLEPKKIKTNPRFEPKIKVEEEEKQPFTQGESGNGFADIAGMSQLKELLSKSVIFVLKNKEVAEKYKLTPPNGMLLYGPPGCGKTFFAEKFAQETKFNYFFVKASDLGSIYVHGSQGKIAELFEAAKAKAPTIICFDEFDALVPVRSSNDNSNLSGEVNEFLTQLNNCAKRGIFVIGTSNRPDMIDPAVLRTGRIDKIIYIGAPDHEARKAIFEIHLNGRPCEDIDFDDLAKLSENYVASDIAYVVNDCATNAAFLDVPITQKMLVSVLNSTRPSLSIELLKQYESIRERMECIENKQTRPVVGFKF